MTSSDLESRGFAKRAEQRQRSGETTERGAVVTVLEIDVARIHVESGHTEGFAESHQHAAGGPCGLEGLGHATEIRGGDHPADARPGCLDRPVEASKGGGGRIPDRTG